MPYPSPTLFPSYLLFPGELSVFSSAGPASDYTPQVTVRLKTLDGRWETCGVDRMPGVLPESVHLSADKWGPLKASFTLARKTGDIHPDLSAFTPCEIEIDGMRVWTGEVWETPASSLTEIEIDGRGIQFDLDDDVLPTKWVHARLADWQDVSEHPDAINRWDKDFRANLGERSIKIGWTRGDPDDLTNVEQWGGVYLDMGEDGFRSALVEYQGGGSDDFAFVAYGSHEVGVDDDGLNVERIVVDASPISTTRQTELLEFTANWRYLTLYGRKPTSGTPEQKIAWVKIFSISVFRDADFVADDETALTPSILVRESRDLGCPLLSKDNSRIAESETLLTHYAPDQERTPRETIEYANLFHDWRAQVDVERRVIFEPKPEAPLVEVGEWAPSAFEDLSVGAGQDIYSDVVVNARDKHGTPIKVRVSDLDLEHAPLAAWQASNPKMRGESDYVVLPGTWVGINPVGFEVKTFAYDAVNGPGMFWREGDDPGPRTAEALMEGGPLTPGREYVLEADFATLTTGLSSPTHPFWGDFRLRIDGTESVWSPAELGRFFKTFRHRFTAVDPEPTIEVEVNDWLPDDASSDWKVFVTNVYIKERGYSLASRHGKRRTLVIDVSSVMSEQECQVLGERLLEDKLRTTLRGQVKAHHGTFRRTAGGAPVAPHELLTMTVEKLRLANMIDPDTGDFGRDGEIATVEYDHASLSAEVAIDADRKRLETLLLEMGLTTE